MREQQAATLQPVNWTVEGFEAFWSNPDPSLVPAVLTEDIVGHWAGLDEPVRGRDDYTRCIAAIVEALPDMQLSVAEHDQIFDQPLQYLRSASRPAARTAPGRALASVISN